MVLDQARFSMTSELVLLDLWSARLIMTRQSCNIGHVQWLSRLQGHLFLEYEIMNEAIWVNMNILILYSFMYCNICVWPTALCID